MNTIEAIIKPFKPDDLKSAMADLDIQGMTITEATGFGRQKGCTEIYRSAEYAVDFIPKGKVEIVASQEMAGQVVNAILGSVKTGKIRYWKLFVLPVGSVCRIRTGETGTEAI